MKGKISKNLQRLLGLTLVAVLSVTSAPVSAMADENGASAAVPEGVVLSYKEVESIDTSFANEANASVLAAQALPTSYSASSNIPSSISVAQKGDYVTSVKSQEYGTCWAFTTASVAESSYIKEAGLKGTTADVDWNEYHLAYYFYNTPADPMGLFGGDYVANTSALNDLNAGGNHIFTLQSLANWIGMSDDTEFGSADALNHTRKGDTEFAFDDAGHLENGYILTMPDMTTTNYQADMNVVKQAIMNYGSVAMSYYADQTGTYYQNGYQYIPNPRGINHAVTIVGWNDNIPANAFPQTAPGNGAWLVKNSWGSWWGFGGYFWLSYYDRSIDPNSYVFDFTSGENYDNNYQYDGGCNPLQWSYNGYSNQVVAANVFTADSKESIEAVGMYTSQVNTNYEVRIYTDLKAGANPTSGTLASTQSGSKTYVGFHTVKLNSPIIVEEGERYAVVITLKKSGAYVSYPEDRNMDNSWIMSYSYAKAGQSYIGSSLTSLTDMNASNTTSKSGRNLRIKAFTDEVVGELIKDDNGVWWYYVNGKIDYSYFGVCTNENGTWYVKDGYAHFDINGLKQCGKSNQWYYFKNGKVQEDVTGLVKNANNWWYVKNGQLDFTYNDVATNSAGTWYVGNGKVDISKNGILSRASGYYYFVNGKVDETRNGIIKNAGQYWYFVKGKIDFNYKGLVKNAGSWWYVQKGKIDLTYDGVATNENGTWYIENGKLDATKNGIYARGGQYYYFKGGKVDTTVNGIVKNAGQYWYFVDGKIDFSYKGAVENAGTMWYVQKGKIDFSYTGISSNADGTYYFTKGKLDTTKNGVYGSGSNYYYFKAGKVDTMVNGIVKNGGQYWYFESGKINFSFVGIVDNAGSQWYVRSGKIDLTFSGTVTYNGSTYTILNGKVVSVQ